MSDRRSVPEIASKPWGFEKRIVNNENYCGKLLYIVKGQHTSLHYHKVKDETFYVHSGGLHVYFHDSVDETEKQVKSLGERGLYSFLQKVVLGPGDSFKVPPKRVHRIFATADTEMYEFSTTHDELDTVRFEGV